MKNSTLIHRIALWLDRKYLSRNTLLGLRQVGAEAVEVLVVEADRQQRRRADAEHQHAQRPQNQPSAISSRHRADQDRLLVARPSTRRSG